MPTVRYCALCKSVKSPTISIFALPGKDPRQSQWLSVIGLACENKPYTKLDWDVLTQGRSNVGVCEKHFKEGDIEITTLDSGQIRKQVLTGIPDLNICLQTTTYGKLEERNLPNVRVFTVPLKGFGREESPPLESVDEIPLLPDSSPEDANAARGAARRVDSFDQIYSPEQDISEDSDSDGQSEEKSVHKVSWDEAYALNRRSIVDDRLLMESFVVCPYCKDNAVGPSVIDKEYCVVRKEGVVRCFNYYCDGCKKWVTFRFSEQQKQQQAVSGRKQNLANLDAVSAVLGNGLTFERVNRFANMMNLDWMASSVFFTNQSRYVIKAVQETFDESITLARNEIKKRPAADGNILLLGGDARFDSPGFSADKCTYTIIDLETDLVVACASMSKCVENKYTNCMTSPGMEPYLAQQLLDELIEEFPEKIIFFVSDASASLMKKLRESQKYRDTVIHYLDVWHVIKGITKALMAAAKSKNSPLWEWIVPIKRYLWYSCWYTAATDGSPSTLLRLVDGILEHVVGDHDNCLHQPYDENRIQKVASLNPASKDYKALKNVLMDKRRRDYLSMCTENLFSSSNESLHATMRVYSEKRLMFQLPSYTCRMQLAVVDHNRNAKREAVLDEEGNVQYKLQKRKTIPAATIGATTKFVAKDYQWQSELKERVHDKHKDYIPPIYEEQEASKTLNAEENQERENLTEEAQTRAMYSLQKEQEYENITRERRNRTVLEIMKQRQKERRPGKRKATAPIRDRSRSDDDEDPEPPPGGARGARPKTVSRASSSRAGRGGRPKHSRGQQETSAAAGDSQREQGMTTNLSAEQEEELRLLVKNFENLGLDYENVTSGFLIMNNLKVSPTATKETYGSDIVAGIGALDLNKDKSDSTSSEEAQPSPPKVHDEDAGRDQKPKKRGPSLASSVVKAQSWEAKLLGIESTEDGSLIDQSKANEILKKWKKTRTSLGAMFLPQPETVNVTSLAPGVLIQRRKNLKVICDHRGDVKVYMDPDVLGDCLIVTDREIVGIRPKEKQVQDLVEALQKDYSF